MADTKISALTADTAPTSDDLVVTVNDPGGTPANKAVTIGNLSKAINLDNVSSGTTNKVYTATEQSKLSGIAANANNYSHPNHTGDVTSVGDGATTIASKAVTLAKMNDLASGTIIGRVTASTGVPEALTGTQATTLINAMVGDSGSGGTKGLVPAPASGDSGKFLKGDGTWGTPAGSGDVSKVGTPVDNQVGVWTGSGTIEGDTALTFDTSTDSLYVGGAVELGNASDTTLSRVSAGVVAVEGNSVLTTATGLPLSGGTMTGNLEMGTSLAARRKITIYSDEQDNSGERIILQNVTASDTTDSAKSTIAFKKVGGNSVAWLTSHKYASAASGGTLHQHFSIETSDASGNLYTRFAIPYDLDTSEIGIYSGNLNINGGVLRLNSGNGANKEIQFGLALSSDLTPDLKNIRWGLRQNTTTETGSNVGSDFGIVRYSDTGTFIDTALFAKRDTAYIGIGTTNPQTRLHVLVSGTSGTPAVGATVVAAFQRSTATTTNCNIDILSGNTATDSGINIGDTDSETIAGIKYDHSVDKMYLKVNNGFKVAIDSSGNVGIGITSPAQKLDVSGSIGLTGSIELGNASDTTISRVSAGVVSIEGNNIIVSGGALGTPASGTLTNCSSLPVSGITASTSTALGVGSIELGHASDTTIARVSAGVVSIEGKNILTTDGGLLTGTITLGENTSIALDPAGSADGKYSGTTITGTGGATIAFGDLVSLDKTTSRWKLADISVAAQGAGDARGWIGMAVTSSTDGNPITVLLHGQIRADAKFPTFTIGSPIYASTTGAVTSTQPTTTDYVIRIVGYAMTADEAYLFPAGTWTTNT